MTALRFCNDITPREVIYIHNGLATFVCLICLSFGILSISNSCKSGQTKNNLSKQMKCKTNTNIVLFVIANISFTSYIIIYQHCPYWVLNEGDYIHEDFDQESIGPNLTSDLEGLGSTCYIVGLIMIYVSFYKRIIQSLDNTLYEISKCIITLLKISCFLLSFIFVGVFFLFFTISSDDKDIKYPIWIFISLIILYVVCSGCLLMLFVRKLRLTALMFHTQPNETSIGDCTGNSERCNQMNSANIATTVATTIVGNNGSNNSNISNSNKINAARKKKNY